MPEIVCAPAQLKEISLPSLADYARGSIIRGGVADWEALVHPGALYHLQTDANDVIWSQDISLADGSWIGIAGNELLTVTAAGMFIFSGITGIWVQDGDIFGIQGSAGRIEFVDGVMPVVDTINFLDCDVGIGEACPVGQKLHVKTTLADNLTAHFENSHITGSYGVAIKAGDDAGNYALDVNDRLGNTLMRVLGDGNIGVGAVNPGGIRFYTITPVADNFAAWFENSHITGSYGVLIRAGDDAGNYPLLVEDRVGTDILKARGDRVVIMAGYGAGDTQFLAGGIITSLSDKSLKRDIHDTEIGLAEVLQLQGKSWRFTEQSDLNDEDNTVYQGFIADDVEKIVPGAVHRDPRGLRSMSYSSLMPAFTEAFREVDARLKVLESKPGTGRPPGVPK